MTLGLRGDLKTSTGLRNNKSIYTILEEPRWPLINPFKRRKSAWDVPPACSISSLFARVQTLFEVMRRARAGGGSVGG